MKSIQVKTGERCCFVDITSRVQEAVHEMGIDTGMIQVFVPHTTAGVTINENADPDVPRDILRRLAALVPPAGDYRHAEGNSDAHIKTLMTGSSALIPVDNGSLILGTWQSIFFTEYDGPRNRRVIINIT